MYLFHLQQQAVVVAHIKDICVAVMLCCTCKRYYHLTTIHNTMKYTRATLEIEMACPEILQYECIEIGSERECTGHIIE